MSIDHFKNTAELALDEVNPVAVPLGEPHALTRTHSVERADGVEAGVWECSPGRWRRQIVQQEFCHFIAGRCTFTPDGGEPLLSLKPYVRKTACIVATGGEVKKGLIQDTFTPVVIDKLRAYGIETLEVVYSGDGVENVRDAVLAMRERNPDMVLCNGGMSVDPDDNTPSGIRAAGADIVCYGAPVLPGAMFLLGYFDDGTPVMGLPGCVMYAGATVFDLVLPKVAADVSVTRADIAAMGEGGLCLGCKPCRYPVCPFGK